MPTDEQIANSEDELANNPVVTDPTKNVASPSSLFRGLLDQFIPVSDSQKAVGFDESGFDVGSSYEAIVPSNPEINVNPSSDSIIVNPKKSFSVAVYSTTESHDFEIRYRLGPNDDWTQDAENIGVAAGSREVLVSDRNIFGFYEVQLRARYNSADGGTVRVSGSYR